mgnify:CR=1 FL=1
MKGLILRVADETKEDVYREILLSEEATFEDFHYAILDAFELNPGEMASFYLSDDDWQKNEEITLMDVGIMDNKTVPLLMNKTLIGSKISELNSKLLYVYDFLFFKSFKIQLINVIDENLIEATLMKSEGKYVTDNSDLASFLMDEDLFPAEKEVPLSDEKKKPNPLEDFDEFDNFQEDTDDSDNPTFENIDDLDI